MIFNRNVIDDIDQREGTVGEEVHDRDTWNIDPTSK